MKKFIKKEKAMLSLKNIFIAALTVALIGCGSSDNKESKTAQESKENSTPKIKITQNAVDTNISQKKSKENSGQFYYSYNKEKNSTQDESSKRRTTIDAYLHIRSPYEKVRITMMIKRLSSDYIIKCSPCHDDYANGVIGPSLLGKSGDFIYKKIMEFKTGKKKNVLMKELVSQIDNKKLKSIADEIANFNKEILKMRREK